MEDGYVLNDGNYIRPEGICIQAGGYMQCMRGLCSISDVHDIHSILVVLYPCF